MTISHATSVEDGIRWIRLNGEADDEGLLSVFRSIWTAPGYTTDLPEIYDLRNLDMGRISRNAAAEPSRLNQEMHDSAPIVRVALLVKSQRQQELSNHSLLHNRYAGVHIRVCNTEAGALAWVRNPPNPF